MSADPERAAADSSPATPAAAAGCAVSVPGAVAGSPAPTAAPPTPLEQRQWRRPAQTAVRVALTATKAARTRSADASAEGVRQITDLTNQILAAEYLPHRPLGVLAGEPGLVEGALAEIAARRRAALARLEACLARQEDAAEDMRSAAEGVAAALGGAAWQARIAVFNDIPLPRAAELLSEVAAMHQKEAAAKRALVEGLRALSEDHGAAGAAGGAGGAGDGRGARGAPDADVLREQLTVGVATWLSRPFVDDERADFILALLTDDMAGF